MCILMCACVLLHVQYRVYRMQWCAMKFKLHYNQRDNCKFCVRINFIEKSERARKLPCLSPYDYAHYVHYDYWLWLSWWWCTHAHCHLMQNHDLLSLIMRWWIFSWIACIIRSMLGSRWLTTTVDINQAKNEKWKERRRRKQIMNSYVQTCV